MEGIINQLAQIVLIFAAVLFLLALFAWLVFNFGFDKILHPREWKSAGTSGEQILYNTLIHQLKIPQHQILRNVYIPTSDNKTSEIDVLVFSDKGLFVFECKNFGGNIYGDANHKKWIQYIGQKKYYFYNPLLQNQNHAKCLRNFLAKHNYGDIPIISLVSTISRGKWHVKNLKQNDYILGLNCHFQDIYRSLPTLDRSENYLEKIQSLLQPLARPSAAIREQHINNIHSKTKEHHP